MRGEGGIRLHCVRNKVQSMQVCHGETNSIFIAAY